MKTFLNFCILIWNIIRVFFKKHHALLTIPAAILLFILSIPVLRWFDPTAAVFDAGKFQFIIFPMIMLFSFSAITWIYFNIVFGTFSNYLKTKMKSDFNAITSWERIRLVYTSFLFIVLVLVCLAKIIS